MSILKEEDKIKAVLIVDVETTGLDRATNDVIEVAAVRYSLLNYAVIDAFSSVLYTKHPNGAEPINHIPQGLLSQPTMAATVAWDIVSDMAHASGAILAHNADFDRQWIPEGRTTILDKPWIDTCNAVSWPKESKTGSSLINLALDHGLGVVDPHRALQDCLLLARLMTRCHEMGHDVRAILAKGLRPQVLVEAVVSYADRDKARDFGFRWDQQTRRWLRKLAAEDCKDLPFPVKSA